MAEMEYRRLGRSGLQVSVLSFGSWVTFGGQLDVRLARDCLQAATTAGVNFFDNAEAYAGGESERIMGETIARARLAPRHSYVISTKLFWGLHDEREHAEHAEPQVPHAGDRRLARPASASTSSTSSTATVPIPSTPIEETVWAMSDIVSSGKALYWGTSEWTADEIRAAWEIADRHHLHKPVVEQPQYNLLRASPGRARVRSASTRTSASASRCGARSRRAC